MDPVLKEEILRKCRKKDIYNEIEEKEYMEEEYEAEALDTSDVRNHILEKEPSFEDILAEKRRKYSAKEEFIFLLYNDMLAYFVTKNRDTNGETTFLNFTQRRWDGSFLRKKVKKRIDEDSDVFSNEEEEGEDFDGITNSEYEEVIEANHCEQDRVNKNRRNSYYWKLTLPDEIADITFINNNSYCGRISRKTLEGEGTYRWNDGIQYKGQFENCRIRGRGFFEWNNDSWCEGDFENGYPHGRATMVDGDNRCMYTGQWHMGEKHGKGYCRYDDNGSYDGDWIMGKMDGVGFRIYPSGARYIGQWKNGLRHGIGTMAWTNGDIYRGRWRCGEINEFVKYCTDHFYV